MGDNKAYYCFEVTYAAYREAVGVASPWELREYLGVPTVVAQDFINTIGSKWLVKYDSRLR